MDPRSLLELPLLPDLSGLWPLLFVLAPFGIMALRNHLVRLIDSLVGLVAMVFVATDRTLSSGAAGLGRQIDATLDGLDYRGGGATDRTGDKWPGWGLVYPLVYLALFALFAGSEFYVAALRFSALLDTNTPLPTLPVHLDVLLGAVWVALGAFYGFVLFDLFHVMPFDKPWNNFSSRAKIVLKTVCFLCLLLALVGVVVFYTWGQMRIVWNRSAEHPAPELDAMLSIGIIAILGAVLVPASALAGWALFTGVPALWTLALLVVRQVLVVVAAAARAIVWLLEKTAELLAAVVDLPANAAKIVWDWLCDLGGESSWKLKRPVFDAQLAHVAARPPALAAAILEPPAPMAMILEPPAARPTTAVANGAVVAPVAAIIPVATAHPTNGAAHPIEAATPTNGAAAASPLADEGTVAVAAPPALPEVAPGPPAAARDVNGPDAAASRGRVAT